MQASSDDRAGARSEPYALHVTERAQKDLASYGPATAGRLVMLMARTAAEPYGSNSYRMASSRTHCDRVVFGPAPGAQLDIHINNRRRIVRIDAMLATRSPEVDSPRRGDGSAS